MGNHRPADAMACYFGASFSEKIKMTMKKVLLLDNHALFRAGLRLLLNSMMHNPIMLEAGTIEEAVAMTNRHRDLKLCLLEPNLRRENGLSFLNTLKTTAPGVPVIIVSDDGNDTLVHSCLDAGATGFVSKSAPPEALSEAVDHVLAGGFYFPAEVLDKYGNSSNCVLTLTRRQRDVLRGLCRGLPTKAIARELSLSNHTVKEYVATVFHLLEVHNRTEAVIKASQMRWLLNDANSDVHSNAHGENTESFRQ